MQIPTIRISAEVSADNDSGFVIINLSDFDSTKHEPFDDEARAALACAVASGEIVPTMAELIAARDALAQRESRIDADHDHLAQRERELAAEKERVAEQARANEVEAQRLRDEAARLAATPPAEPEASGKSGKKKADADQGNQ